MGDFSALAEVEEQVALLMAVCACQAAIRSVDLDNAPQAIAALREMRS